jgi:hypothetical protein
VADLTAIDILIHPDDSMIARATTVNERMLKSVPAPTGFALDEHHQPHITTLQRYVRTNDLDQVYAAVQATLGQVDLSTLTFTAVAIKHMGVSDGVGLAGIVVQPGSEVLEFQSKLIDAVAPYVEAGGTAAAYVRTEAEPDINQPTIDYIEHYVPDHSGDNYLAHITVGLATLDDLAAIEAETFEPLRFGPAGVSIYHLGNNGTAAALLTDLTI